MTNSEKIAQLREEIERVIRPLITEDCHLTNLPYHTNIGDALIWNGAMALLSSTGKRILSQTSEGTWNGKRVKQGDIIVFDGGGNIGDIWRDNMNFFLSVVDANHNNRIVVLPNSAWYSDESLIAEDARRMGAHPDLHLIARDNYSYDFMLRHFGANHVYLAPDMAFYIPDSMLAKARATKPEEGSTLYLRRIDKEFVSDTAVEIPEATVSDWPTMTSPTTMDYVYAILGGKLRRYQMYRCLDLLSRQLIRNRYVGVGSRFIAEFDRIVTTRLHTLILSVLVGRPVEYIDNISGKLSAYVDTWLSDLQTVRPNACS